MTLSTINTLLQFTLFNVPILVCTRQLSTFNTMHRHIRLPYFSGHSPGRTYGIQSRETSDSGRNSRRTAVKEYPFGKNNKKAALT